VGRFWRFSRYDGSTLASGRGNDGWTDLGSEMGPPNTGRSGGGGGGVARSPVLGLTTKKKIRGAVNERGPRRSTSVAWAGIDGPDDRFSGVASKGGGEGCWDP